MKFVANHKVVINVPVISPVDAENAGLPTFGLFAVPIPKDLEGDEVLSAYINDLVEFGELQSVATQVVATKDSCVPMNELIGHNDLDLAFWRFEED